MKSGKMMCIQSIIFVVLVGALAMQVGLTAHGPVGHHRILSSVTRSAGRSLSAIGQLAGFFQPTRQANCFGRGSYGPVGYSVAVSGDTVVAATPYGGEICGFPCRKPASNLFVKPTAYGFR
jgi:hypothetical protein